MSEEDQRPASPHFPKKLADKESQTDFPSEVRTSQEQQDQESKGASSTTPITDKGKAPSAGTAGWQVVTTRSKTSRQVQKPFTTHQEPKQCCSIPKDFEKLSTEELIGLLQQDNVKTQLLRCGIPVREELIRWFQELQAPSRKPGNVTSSFQTKGTTNSTSSTNQEKQATAKSKGSPTAPRTKWDPLGVYPKPAPWAKEEQKQNSSNTDPESEEANACRVTMRAEAPEFVPSDLVGTPAGTMLVPCVLPPAEDGSIAVPPGHIIIFGAAGIPDGVPLVIPMEHIASFTDTSFPGIPLVEIPIEDPSFYADDDSTKTASV